MFKINVSLLFRLCCQCGTLIEPNAANMCIGCLRTQVDITEDIPKQVTLQFCRNCERYGSDVFLTNSYPRVLLNSEIGIFRYFEPPSEWISCTLESRELLTLCLNKLKGLNKVKLVDAGFVWTEPHSKRIKVSIAFFICRMIERLCN